jgi:hypothetical protein
MALPFTIKSILKQKKNYANSKHFTMQKNNLQKNPLPKAIIFLQDIISVKLISNFNTSQDIIIFQKSSYKNRPIIITKGPKSL